MLNRARVAEQSAVDLLELCFTRAHVEGRRIVVDADDALLDALACFQADLADLEPEPIEPDGDEDDEDARDYPYEFDAALDAYCVGHPIEGALA